MFNIDYVDPIQEQALFESLGKSLKYESRVLKTTEQHITISGSREFYSATNYIDEVYVITLILSYSFNNKKDKSKFIKSEFGEKKFQRSAKH